MGRRFEWKDYGEGHAVLYGPKEGMVAAVVERDRGIPDRTISCWRVTSRKYHLLNFEEADASLPMDALKRRTLIWLGEILRQRKDRLEEDLSSILGLLFAE